MRGVRSRTVHAARCTPAVDLTVHEGHVPIQISLLLNCGNIFIIQHYPHPPCMYCMYVYVCCFTEWSTSQQDPLDPGNISASVYIYKIYITRVEYRIGNGTDQKWDTCWFSANTWPINFKQRPNCSSPESWFALTTSRLRFDFAESSGFSACPVCFRNETVTAEMGHIRLTSSV